jgi:cysteine synthase A
MRFDGILDAIGHTPLIRLRIDAAPSVEVYAKLELQNLFGMKDRVARHTILEARRIGLLADGAPIIESTSGTLGLGVAMVGAALGHPVHVVTDPRIDRISLAKLRALGAEVHVVDTMTGQGWQGTRLARLAHLRDTLPGAFWPEQYANPDNPAAYRSLAAEVLDDLGSVDVLVGSVGTGGSLCGSARALRERLPGLKVVGVDSVGSVLFGQPDRPGRLQGGLGNSLMPKNLDRRLVDEVHWLNDREAFTATEELARRHQIFGGNTSGSVYRVMRELATHAAPGTRIVGILPDRGDRYATTVYDEEYWNDNDVRSQPVAPAPVAVAPGTVVDSWSTVRWQAEQSTQHLLFIEANTSGTGMLALQTASRLGLTPVLLTNNPARYTGLAAAGGEVLPCDTTSIPALRTAIKDRFRRDELAGLTTTSDFYVTTVAELADWLGLPRNSVDAMRTCRDKALLRARLRAAGIDQPRFATLCDPAQARAAVAEVGLPCVVKPVDDSASHDVLLCTSEEQVAAHAAHILASTVNVRGLPTVGAVLVEEYVDGPELSVELFSWGGETHVVGITGKSVTALPYFVEQRHLFPAQLTADVAEAIVATARAAVAAAGVTLGATHTEVRVAGGRVAVIEINPRLAGGMIPTLIHHATGVDLLEQQVRVAANLPPDLTPTRRRHAGIQFLLADEPGELSTVDGVALARTLAADVTITAAPGTTIRPPRSGYDRLGHVIAHGDSAAAVAKALTAAHNHLRIVLLDTEEIRAA